MKGLERFVELCLETWPNSQITFIVAPSCIEGRLTLEVQLNGYLSPVVFDTAALVQPHQMIRTLKATIPSWQPMPT